MVDAISMHYKRYKPETDICLEQNYMKMCTSFTIGPGPSSEVGNVSGYRCVSDFKSRGRKFDPGPVPYFREDRSRNNFYLHSPFP